MRGFEETLGLFLLIALILPLLISTLSFSEPQLNMYTDGLILNAVWGPSHRLAVATTGGKVILFDGQTGNTFWETKVGYMGDSPILDWSPSGLLAVSLGKSVVVLDGNGDIVWNLK